MSAIDVQLRATWIENVGYRYDVLLDGEVIVARSRDPEHDAARVLLGRGLRGRFRTVDFRTGKPRMIFDIEKAAKLRTVERDRGGLTVEPYLPMSTDDTTRLRPPSLHQGRLLARTTVERRTEPIEAAGGERCAGGRRPDTGIPSRLYEDA